MLKNKRLLTGTIILFLTINTAYYWESFLGPWEMLTLPVMFITYIGLFVGLLYQAIAFFKKHSLAKSIPYQICCTAILLGLIAWKPFGIINYEYFEAKDLLIAENEGAANCTSLIKLKVDNDFSIRDICFGVYKYTGTYTLRNDTIFFKFKNGNEDNVFKFGLVQSDTLANGKTQNILTVYRQMKEARPAIFQITKNELLKSSD